MTRGFRSLALVVGTSFLALQHAGAEVRATTDAAHNSTESFETRAPIDPLVVAIALSPATSPETVALMAATLTQTPDLPRCPEGQVPVARPGTDDVDCVTPAAVPTADVPPPAPPTFAFLALPALGAAAIGAAASGAGGGGNGNGDLTPISPG